jgi:hypothetical protein
VTFWRAAGDRLRSGDLPQVGLLVLAVVAAAMVVAWPARPGVTHEAWYAVAQTRSVVLAVLALGYGVGLAGASSVAVAATALGVLAVALATLPIELAAHVASAPATPAWWAWAATPVAVSGQLAVGVALGALLRLLRLGSLTFLVVPAVIVGAVAVDVRLGVTLLNPLTAALQVAPAYLAFHAVAALLGGVWWLARRRREGRHP